MKIDDAVNAFNDAKAQMLLLYPDLADDEDALFDTVDGEVDLDKALERILRQREHDLAFVDALKSRSDDMKARRERFERRAEALKELVRGTLERVGRRKLELPEFTVSTGFSRGGVVITDETAIPPSFTRVLTEPDKTKIKAALEAGEIVPGATLSNGKPTCTVRTK